MTRRWPVWPLAAVAVAACGSSGDAMEERSFAPELIARFGSIDGALSLRTIGSMTLTQGAGDTVLITQFGVPAILMLSSAGDSLGMIGRAGSGPGEFSAPLAPAILADTIWVQDVRGPILRFDARGAFIDRLQPNVPPLGPFQNQPRLRAALADGTLLMQGSSNPIGREARAAVRSLALVRVDRRGTVLDTLALIAIRESSYFLEFADGSGIVGSHPAANPDLAAPDPGGSMVVTAALEIDRRDRHGYTLRWIDLAGDTLAAHFVAVPPVSSEPIRTAWVERLVENEGRPRGMIEAAVADVPFPDTQAPAQALFVDVRRRAWVRSPHASADSASWSVVDREHGRLGSFALPAQVRLLAAGEDEVWGWTVGPYDEPYVLRFRVGTPVSPVATLFRLPRGATRE